MRLRNVLWVLGALFIVFLTLTLILSLLYTSHWWFYTLIYLLLIGIWYRPMLVFYHSLRAGHMLKQRKFEEAAQSYENIAFIKRKEGYGDYARGLANYYRRQFSQANRFFEQALDKGIRTQKQSIEPLVKVARLSTEIEIKNWKQAQETMLSFEKEMEEGKKVSPKILSLYYALKGEYLYKKGKIEEAHQAFNQAYARFPDLKGEEAYYFACTLYARGLKGEAIHELKQILAPKHRWKLFRLSFEEVQKQLRQWEKSNPGT